MNTEHEHYHEEAQVVAWSDIMVNGWKISVTARQGATSADIVANVLALGDALKTLREKYNATPYLNGNGPKAANTALATAAHAPTSDEEAWNALQSASAQRAQAAQAAQPAPVTMQAPTLANGAEDPGYCRIHGCAMKRHEKNGEVWYSHKDAGGAWCRGKYNPPSLGY